MARAHVQSDRALVASKPRRRGEFESPVGSATLAPSSSGLGCGPFKPGDAGSNPAGAANVPPAKATVHQEPPTNDGDSRADTFEVRYFIPEQALRLFEGDPWTFIMKEVPPPAPTAAPVPAAPVSERPPGKRRGEVGK